VGLGELVPLAAEAVADADLASARKRFGVVAREWRDLTAGLEVHPDLLARYQELEAQQTARDTSARDADAKARREALGRLQHLATRVDPLPMRPDLSLKAAERALRDVRAALAAAPPLPTKQDFEGVPRPLKATQTALVPKVQALRAADGWKRFP